MPQDWRNQDAGYVHQFKTWAAKLVRMRLDKGRRLYGTGTPGSRFLGDPLEHCEQEQADSLYYMRMARNERSSNRALMRECQELLVYINEYPDIPPKVQRMVVPVLDKLNAELDTKPYQFNSG